MSTVKVTIAVEGDPAPQVLTFTVGAPPPPPPPPPANSPAALPALTVDVSPTAVLRSTPVKEGADLQALLNAALPGDCLVLDAGATWIGNYTLPVKAGATHLTPWITIRTGGVLPPAGTRITPATDGPQLATIQTPNAQPALQTALGAHGWRLIGLELCTDPAYQAYPVDTVLVLGDGTKAQSTLALVASEIIVDRCHIHGAPGQQVKRGIGLNSASTAIVDCVIDECHGKGFDSQAICGWNGPGPFRIENNRLEGAGENVMFGGADATIPNLVPSDITIRRNHFFKPLAWKGVYTIKNILETKNAQRVLVEGNVLENSWPDGQTGFAFTFKSTNQNNSAPWSTTQDLTVRYNIVRGAAMGMNLAAHPEIYPVVPAARVLVEHNLMVDIGYNNGGAGGRMFLILGPLTGCTYRKNTTIHSSPAPGMNGQWLLFDIVGSTAMEFSDNISTWGGPYGAVAGTGTSGANATLAQFAPGAVFTNNGIIGEPIANHKLYPASTLWAPDVASVFVDPTNGDYTVKPGHPMAGLGADIAAVMAATKGVV